MLPVVLVALLAIVAGGPTQPSRPLAVTRVPDEEGTIVLPGGPTLQAVAADVDGDGAREVIRLVGGENQTIWIEVWAEDGGEWRLMAAPGVAAPPDDPNYRDSPARLLVRQVGGKDRVTLVRQPDAGLRDSRECCLLLTDLEIHGNALTRIPVAEAGSIADSIHVIDLDGDGTDELLAAYSLSPLFDASTPTEARVFRWAGDHFDAPTTTALLVGSGSTFFVLGDSDGVPGDEAAVISGSALGALFRVGLGPNDSLVAENSGLVVNQALGVPLGGAGRAIAVVLPQDGLEVREWPHGEAIGPPIAVRRIQGSTLIGTVDVAGTSRLLAHRADFGVLHVLELPFLGPLGAGPVVPSQAAYSLPPGPLEAYVGQLPGGGPDGRPAAIVDGFLLPGLAGGDAATPIGALAGSQPIGLVGPDRSWLAVQHSGLPRAATDPAGGRLAQPLFLGGEVALAPLDAAATPEVDHGAFEPPTDRAVALEDGVTGIGSDGLTAEVHAPPGSHVYISPPDDDRDPSPEIVGATGELDIHVAPAGATADSNAEVTMTVATPAGHAYVSRWFLRLFEETPTLNAQASTPLGSTAVTVAGWTVPSAEVEVGGKPVAVDHDGRFSTRVDLPPWPTAVTVTARDPIGNEADIVVTGVGLFDYRGLPWIPIALVLIGAVAVGLILRVPTTRLSNRPASDDGVLEELDPADRL